MFRKIPLVFPVIISQSGIKTIRKIVIGSCKGHYLSKNKDLGSFENFRYKTPRTNTDCQTLDEDEGRPKNTPLVRKEQVKNKTENLAENRGLAARPRPKTSRSQEGLDDEGRPINLVKSKEQLNKEKVENKYTRTRNVSSGLSYDLFETEQEVVSKPTNFAKKTEDKQSNYKEKPYTVPTKARIVQPYRSPNLKGEVLFGIHPLLLALEVQRRQFYKLYLKRTQKDEEHSERLEKIRLMAVDRGILVETTKVNFLDKISGGRPHQGACLDVSSLQYEEICETDKEPKSNCLWVVLENVVDPMNFGAILRTSCYLGVDKIITVKGNSCPLTPIVSKASSGAMEVMKINLVDNLCNFLQNIKQTRKWTIIGTKGWTDSTENLINVPNMGIEDINLSKPTIILMGNEGRGLSPEVIKLCDGLFAIPPSRSRHLSINSLNVSVATGIVLHSLLKKKY